MLWILCKGSHILQIVILQLMDRDPKVCHTNGTAISFSLYILFIKEAGVLRKKNESRENGKSKITAAVYKMQEVGDKVVNS